MRVLACILFILSGRILFAQTKLQLRPYIGLQQSFSKQTNTAENLPATFHNNTFEVEADYGIGLRCILKDKSGIEAGIRIINAGESYAYRHKRDLSTYPTGPYTIAVFSASALEYSQLYAGYWHFINISKNQRRVHFKLGLNANLAMNLRANEDPNSGKFILSGINGQGERFINEDTTYNVKEFTISFPLQIQIQSYLNMKSFLELTIYYNHGIMRHHDFEAWYILTASNTRFTNKLRINGSVLAVNLSYPITLWNSEKKKKRLHPSN
jgi:hypothetical protein